VVGTLTPALHAAVSICDVRALRWQEFDGLLKMRK